MMALVNLFLENAMNPDTDFSIESRVLRCLSGLRGKQSLQKLTEQFNKLYPPRKIGVLCSLPVHEHVISEVLNTLIKDGMALKEVSAIHRELFFISRAGSRKVHPYR
jgi:hypothetical protein